MKKVYITGSIKDENGQRMFDSEGYLKGKLFYPDKNNVRIFIKVSTCHLNWKTGILAKHIEEVDDD